MTTRKLTMLLASALLAVPAIALADEGLAVEGPGYPINEGTVIHPVVGAELGLTNNIFYESSDERPLSTGIFRLVAEAAIASKEIEEEPVDPLLLEDGDEAPAEPAAQKVQFRLGGALRYEEFISPEATARAQRTLGADIKGNVVVSPEGTFAFVGDEHFVRDTRPTNFESFDSNNRMSNRLGLALKYQPGGRTLSGILKWENELDYWEDGDQRFANRMINAIHARSEWEFFPYTKAFADVSYGFIGGFGSENLDGMAFKRSAQPIRGGVGIATAITEIFTVKAHFGWGYASYSGGASYNAPIAGVEIGYRYIPTGRVVVEYNWDRRDSVNADFYIDHGFVGRIDQQFDRVVLTAKAEAHLRSYKGIPMAVGPATRDDVILALGARGQYVLKDWLAIIAQYDVVADQTDYRSSFGGDSDDPSFVRHELSAGVRAAF
jgi:hypothetical protein